MEIMEDGQAYDISVNDLALVYNPMLKDVWDCGVITPEDVSSAPVLPVGAIPRDDWDIDYFAVSEKEQDAEVDASWRSHNISRIAWLMKNEWPIGDDEQEPIHIDCYRDGDGFKVEIVDGNHRVSAAILAGMESINVEVTGTPDALAYLGRKVRCFS